MDKITRRRHLVATGQAALDYYDDTGLCVFCTANDLTCRSHEDWCPVKPIADAEIPVTPARVKRKAKQRAIADDFITRANRGEIRIVKDD